MAWLAAKRYNNQLYSSKNFDSSINKEKNTKKERHAQYATVELPSAGAYRLAAPGAIPRLSWVVLLSGGSACTQCNDAAYCYRRSIVSVCVCVCWSQSQAVPCRVLTRVGPLKKPRISWGTHPQRKGQFWASILRPIQWRSQILRWGTQGVWGTEVPQRGPGDEPLVGGSGGHSLPKAHSSY